MGKLSFKEFLKLSEGEKSERYEELSEHHKFLARISQNTSARVIPEEEMTEDERKQLKKIRENIETEDFKEREKRFNAMLKEAGKKRKDYKK
jgi:succinate dehydrogenase/fumarate reductase flavoprotein subunit